MAIKSSEINLSNLYDGGVEEVFNKVCQQVIDNIQDVNTDPTAVREINIKISLKPSKNRDACEYTVAMNPKLASYPPFGSVLLIDDGKFHEMKQGDMFAEAQNKIKDLPTK